LIPISLSSSLSFYLCHNNLLFSETLAEKIEELSVALVSLQEQNKRLEKKVEAMASIESQRVNESKEIL